MLRKRLTAIFAAISLLITSSAFMVAADNAEPLGMELVAENSEYKLFADLETARFELYVNATGTRFSSNLTREQTSEDKIAKAKFKRELESQIILRYRDIEFNQDITTSSGILKGGSEIKTEKKKNGFDATYIFDNAGFELTLEYRIDDAGLTATLKNESIKEKNKKSFLLVAIDVLPNFATASVDESGYMLVPDGCGALIYLNNGKTSVKEYSQRIYGADATKMNESKQPSEQTARLPVYGMKTADRAFVAVVENGAALTNVMANISGKKTSYNSVFGSYNLRSSDLYSLGNSSSATTNMLYQNSFDKATKYTVRYIPVAGDTIDYNGMAATYKDYLIDKLDAKVKKTDERMFVELYGAAIAQKSFLGIPYRATVPLTTYDEVGKTVKKLKSLGIDDLIIQYTDWDDGNVNRKVLDKVRPMGALGGKKKLNSMLNSLKKQNVDIYLNADFERFTYSGRGYSKSSDSAELLSKTTALQKKFLLSTLMEDEDAPWEYLLSLNSFKKSTQSYYKSAKKLAAAGISMADIGREIYSDYSSLKSNRDITEDYFKAAAELYSSKKGIITSGGNAYMLEYADFISSVPVSGSDFDITDEEIPFYQLALSGIVGMSTPAINQEGNPEEMFLKSIETGISPGFVWFYSDPYVLKNTDSNHLYGASFEGWRKKAAAYYEKWQKVRSSAENSALISYKNINSKVSVSTFENGTSVIVNYGKAVYTDQNGNTVEPLSYLVIGGNK